MLLKRNCIKLVSFPFHTSWSINCKVIQIHLIVLFSRTLSLFSPLIIRELVFTFFFVWIERVWQELSSPSFIPGMPSQCNEIIKHLRAKFFFSEATTLNREDNKLFSADCSYDLTLLDIVFQAFKLNSFKTEKIFYWYPLQIRSVQVALTVFSF